MADDDQHTSRKLAIGALIAGAAGYIAGLLTAPKSGEETREDIVDKAGDLKDQAAEELKKAHDELDDQPGTGKMANQGEGLCRGQNEKKTERHPRKFPPERHRAAFT